MIIDGPGSVPGVGNLGAKISATRGSRSADPVNGLDQDEEAQTGIDPEDGIQAEHLPAVGCSAVHRTAVNLRGTKRYAGPRAGLQLGGGGSLEIDSHRHGGSGGDPAIPGQFIYLEIDSTQLAGIVYRGAADIPPIRTQRMALVVARNCAHDHLLRAQSAD